MSAYFPTRLRRAAACAAAAAVVLLCVISLNADRLERAEPASIVEAPLSAAGSEAAAVQSGEAATALHIKVLETCNTSGYTVTVGGFSQTFPTVATGHCICGAAVKSLTVTDANILALLSAPTCTSIDVKVNGTSFVSWIRTEIVRASGTETACALQANNGGGCDNTNLCNAGYASRTNQTFTVAAPDSDGDGILDCSDDDGDNDGVVDGDDNCPANPNPTQADTDQDGPGDACDPFDFDSDGIWNDADNCPTDANPGQQDNDGNGEGDACDRGWDIDGDGVANTTDNCPATPNGNQADADADGVGNSCDTEPVLAAVPWLGHESLSHPAISGKPMVLQAVFAVPASGNAAGVASATWDAGDGSGPVAIGVSNSLVLEKVHTYGGAVGQPYTATIRVVDTTGAVHTDTFKVVLEPDTREARVNVAIDSGLWNLHKRTQRITSDGVLSAFWTGGGYNQAPTASAVQAFEINNHRESADPTVDPYATNVARGLRWLLSAQHGIMGRIDVPVQNGNDPDANGNGYGLSINNNNHTPYIVGQVMDAIVASGTPAKFAESGQATYVKGRKYKDIVQDLLDGYSYGMGDNTGGWHYGYAGTSGGNDTSASHWWGIGVLAAEVWHLDAPEWVKSIQRNVGLPLMQAFNPVTSAGDGHFGYTNNTNIAWDAGTNVTAAGLILMNADDMPQTHPRFVAAANYVKARYNSSMGNLYTMYQLTKAMRTALDEPGATAPITLLGGTIDWYAGYADHLVQNQINLGGPGAGHFSQTSGTAPINQDLSTSWAILILSQSLFELPPSAACTANPSTIGTNGGLVQFSAAGSFHPDPDVTLVSYSWNFGDGSAAGTGVTTSHTFTRPDSFPTTRNVQVTVTDSQGLTATSSCPVTIVDTNVPPDANAGGPYSMCMGGSLTLDGMASADEDGTVEAYAWSWGTINFAAPNATTGRVDASAAFEALGPGTYNLGLQVTDNDDAVNSEFTTVTVKPITDASCNQPPDAIDDAASTFSGTPVTVTVLGNDSDPNAGDTLAVTGTSAGPANGTAVVNGNGTITYTPNTGFAGIDAFSYAISDGKSGADTAVVTITVTKRAATVTAGDGTKVYGSADPAIGATSVGFEAADGITVSATRAAGETVGSYATTAAAAGAALGNYDVTYVAGTFTITPKAATVTAGDGTKVYGSADPAIGATSVGFEAADGITVSATRGAGETVGSYATTATAAGAALGNYDVTYVAGTFTITPKAATVTAGDGTKVYGSADPAIGATSTGFEAADGITVSATRAAGETVGSYATTATADGAALGNYDVTYVAGTFTITPKAATVTAGDGTKVYGSADPAIGATSAGFEAADGITVSATRAAGETVGSYATTATAAGAALGNYDVTYAAGTFSITPAALTVTATSVSRHWGTPNPALTVTYAGFQFGDDPSSLGGTLTVTTTATQFSAVGSYPIVPFGQTSPNYTIGYVNGTLTVTNDAPVCTAAAPSIAQIWPPNHQWTPITVNGVTDANGDATTITITGIFQDEPVGSGGSGNTGPDGQGVDTSTAQVRAERAGNPKTPGDGRVYHISFTATDAAGGSCTGTVQVGVPHDQGGKAQPIVDGGPLYDSTIMIPRR